MPLVQALHRRIVLLELHRATSAAYINALDKQLATLRAQAAADAVARVAALGAPAREGAPPARMEASGEVLTTQGAPDAKRADEPRVADPSRGEATA